MGWLSTNTCRCFSQYLTWPTEVSIHPDLGRKKIIIKRSVREHWWRDTAKLPCDPHLLEDSFWGATEWSILFYFLCYQIHSLTQYLLPATETSTDFYLFLATLAFTEMWAFLQWQRTGPTLWPQCPASHCGGFSCCGAQPLGRMGFRVIVHGLSSSGSRALDHRLNSCGIRAQLLRGMWDLPGPGMKLLSPELAGGFFTTEPLGKPSIDFKKMLYCKSGDADFPS